MFPTVPTASARLAAHTRFHAPAAVLHEARQDLIEAQLRRAVLRAVVAQLDPERRDRVARILSGGAQ